MSENIKYVTIKQIAEDSNYPFTMAMLRNHLLHRHKNGLSSAVRKIGKRLFMRIDLFNAWIENQACRG